MPSYPCDAHDDDHAGVFMVSNSLTGDTLSLCAAGLGQFAMTLYRASEPDVFAADLDSIGYVPKPAEPAPEAAPAKKAAPRKASTAKAKTAGARAKPAVSVNGESGESASELVDPTTGLRVRQGRELGADGLPLNPDF